MYAHNFIHHIRCHHKWVGTPHDPTTAKLGESLFQYHSRVIPEGFVDVWNYEQDRLKKEKKDSLIETIMGNRMITFSLGQAAYLCLVYYIFGAKALGFHLLYSLIVSLMFETVNYLEHYGLVRKLLPGSTDDYESVKITHSWNAPQ